MSEKTESSRVPSLLDWLEAQWAAPLVQRVFRFGLALLLGLWGLLLANTLGLLLLLAAAGLLVWGLRIRGANALPSLPAGAAPAGQTPTVLQTEPAAQETRVRPSGSDIATVVRWGAALGSFAVMLAGSWLLSGRVESNVWPALGLLFGGALMLVLWVRQEKLDAWWSPSPVAAQAGALTLPAGTSLRWRVAGAAAALSVITFFSVPDNTFTPLGVMTWVASLILWLVAFWDGSISWHAVLRRRWSGELRWSLTSPIFLLLVVIGIAATVRLARLDTVPIEMTSDHVEKLLDVARILEGSRPIFLPNNGGREVLGFYLYALVSSALGLDAPTYLLLKTVNAVIGLLTLPLIFLAAREISDDDALALLAALAAGLAWWPNSISRNGLRLPLAPFFAALALWLFIRALKRRERNSALLAGLALGLGLYGYTAIRIMPLVMALAFGLYALYSWQRATLAQATRWLALAGIIFVAAALPLLRYAYDAPDAFLFRTLTRIGGDPGEERSPTWEVFWGNVWNSLRMFHWTSDNAWLLSPPGQPALDWVMGGLFIGGLGVLAYRAFSRRGWLEAFLILGVPVALLPSTLALAFPIENPSLPRSGSALPPVFIIVALGLRLLLETGRRLWAGKAGTWLGLGLMSIILAISYQVNWRILFVDYAEHYSRSARNASEVGEVIRGFANSIGSYDAAWVCGYPHWVDTRAVGIYAGNFWRDYAIWFDDLESTQAVAGPKLFILNIQDTESRPDGEPPTLPELRRLYPNGQLSTFKSRRPDNKDFLMYFVPAAPTP
ncbi:MAG: glycosyltransferase family 39 protein [Anaerolineales bacterium]|nr:glycosyltransferase family 39 protein [Anaerolineales bacterium]